jgi:nicotinamidase-related amidase
MEGDLAFDSASGMTAHKVHLPEWAIERGRQLNDFHDVDPARTAFVAIDMQNVFLAPGEVFGNPNALAIAGTVNRLAAAFRAAGSTIVWTRQTVDHRPPRAMPDWQYDLSIPEVRAAVATMEAGTHSHALHADMAVGPADIVIDKYRYGAFSCPGGALEAVLEVRDIDTIVIAGTLTNCCCDSTAREANMRGYRVFFLSDATATRTDEEHNAALLTIRLMFGDVRTTEEMLALLARATAGESRSSLPLA